MINAYEHNNTENHPGTAIITGASRGIGKAAALELAQAGWNLIICAKQDITGLEETRRLAAETGAEVTMFQCDVSSSDSVSEMCRNLGGRLADIELLVNNAGTSYIGLLQNMSDEDWHRVISTDLNSLFYMCRAVIPGMIRKHSGRIINVSSMWGQAGASCETAYSAAKGGVDSFTKALAKELAPSGISVNAIAPGVVDTEMNSQLSPAEKAELAEEIPAGRFAAPEEIGRVIALMAAFPSYLTGQIIRVDGGLC